MGYHGHEERIESACFKKMLITLFLLFVKNGMMNLFIDGEKFKLARAYTFNKNTRCPRDDFRGTVVIVFPELKDSRLLFATQK